MAVLDPGAEKRALAFAAEKFGVRLDGRFGQRFGSCLWNAWGFRLHDHWRAGNEQFFYEQFAAL